VVAPGKPDDGTFRKHAHAVEPERIESQPVFDDATTGDTGVVQILEESEGAH
jgi:hypothetical protein